MRLPPPKEAKDNLGPAFPAAIAHSSSAGISFSQAGLGHTANPINEKRGIYPRLLSEPVPCSPRAEPVTQCVYRAASPGWLEKAGKALAERSERRDPSTDLAHHCSVRAKPVLELPSRGNGGRQLSPGRAEENLEYELMQRINRLENYNACLLQESTQILMHVSERSQGASSDGKVARTLISPTRRQIAPTRGAPGHEWVGNMTPPPCSPKANLREPCQAATQEGGIPQSRFRRPSDNVIPVPESHVSMITGASEASYRAASPPPSLSSGELCGQMKALRYQQEAIRQRYAHTETFIGEHSGSATAERVRLAEEFEARKTKSLRGTSSDPAKPASMQCSASSILSAASHKVQEDRSPLIHALSPSQSSHSGLAFNRAVMEDDISASRPWHEKGRFLLASTANGIVSRPSSRDNSDRMAAATTAASASRDDSEGRSLPPAADPSKFLSEAYEFLHAEPQTANGSGRTSQQLYRTILDLSGAVDTEEKTNGIQSSPKVIAGSYVTPPISPERASPAQHVLGQLSPVPAASLQQSLSVRLSPFSTSSARADQKLITPRGRHQCAESFASELGSGKSAFVSEARSRLGQDDISFVSAILSSGKGLEPEISGGRGDKLYSFSDQIPPRTVGSHNTTSTKAMSLIGKQLTVDFAASDIQSLQFSKHSDMSTNASSCKMVSPPGEQKLDSAVSETRSEKTLGSSGLIHASVCDDSTSPKVAAFGTRTQDDAGSAKAEDAWQTLSERTKVWAEELAQSRDRVALRRQATLKAAELSRGAAKDTPADAMPLKPTAAASETYVAHEPIALQTPCSYHRRPSPSAPRSSSPASTVSSRLAGSSVLQTPQSSLAGAGASVLPVAHHPQRSAACRRKVAATAEENAAADSSLPLVYRSAVHAVECFGWAAIHGETKEWTALHWAAAEGRVDICKRLLASAADPGQPDHTGQSAMTHAQSSGHAEVLRVLQQSRES